MASPSPRTHPGMAAAAAPIGVFDSGIGGLSILRALRAELPHERFVYVADTAHAPYGERSDDFVLERAIAITRELVEVTHIKALVVACNTATAAAIAPLRARWPQLPVIGVEPALKPAAARSRTGRVGVLATRGTLGSDKFAQLQDALAGQAEFVLQPCDGLAAAIENADRDQARTLLASYLGALGPLGDSAGQVDTLVLGCTHYALVMDIVRALAGPKVQVLETGDPVARQTRRLLSESGLLADESVRGQIDLRSTASAEAQQALHTAADRWLGTPGAC